MDNNDLNVQVWLARMSDEEKKAMQEKYRKDLRRRFILEGMFYFIAALSAGYLIASYFN